MTLNIFSCAYLFLNGVFIQAFLLVPTYCSFWSWIQFIFFSLQNVSHFLILRMSWVILDCILHIRNVKLWRFCFLLFFSGDCYFLCCSGCFSLLDLNFVDLKCKPQFWSSVVSEMVWGCVNTCMSRQSLGIPSLAFSFPGFPRSLQCSQLLDFAFWFLGQKHCRVSYMYPHPDLVHHLALG